MPKLTGKSYPLRTDLRTNRPYLQKSLAFKLFFPLQKCVCICPQVCVCVCVYECVCVCVCMCVCVCVYMCVCVCVCPQVKTNHCLCAATIPHKQTYGRISFLYPQPPYFDVSRNYRNVLAFIKSLAGASMFQYTCCFVLSFQRHKAKFIFCGSSFFRVCV